MNADIEVKAANALTLPEDAIANFEGKEYVFIQKDQHHYLMQEVQLGTKENSFISISNGEVFSNQKVVLTGAYALLMQLKNKAEE
jgi:cobalt-zinc-cadmium efflux system membrane fusion protein